MKNIKNKLWNLLFFTSFQAILAASVFLFAIGEIENDKIALWFGVAFGILAFWKNIIAYISSLSADSNDSFWCKQHQKYYKDECPDCSDQEQRELAHDAGMSEKDFHKKS